MDAVKVNDKIMEEVLVAVVTDAANIYMNAVVTLMHLQNKTRKYRCPDRVRENALDRIWDAETFFCSDYGEGLTHQPGMRVMKALNERAADLWKQQVETGVNTHRQLRPLSGKGA